MPKIKSASAVFLLVAATFIAMVALMPGALAAGEKVQGTVKLAGSGTMLQGVQIMVFQDDGGFFTFAMTNSTGQYSVDLLGPGMYNVIITNQSQSGNLTVIDVALGQTYVLNATLQPDITAPVISQFDLDVTQGVSKNNPATLEVTVQENWLAKVPIRFYQVLGHTGTEYELQTMKYYTTMQLMDNPGLPMTDYTYTQTSPGTNTTSLVFDGTSKGAMISNGSSSWYVTYSLSSWTGEDFLTVYCYYENSTIGANYDSWYMQFNSTTLALEQIDSYNETNMMFTADVVDLQDTTGTLMIMEEFATFNTTDESFDGEMTNVTPFISISEIEPLVIVDPLPSGDYFVIIWAEDFGGNQAMDWLQLTVDNALPIADAGANISIKQGQTVTFNGTASYDAMDIANYTWTYTVGTDDYVLYGEAPVSEAFNVIGVYEVTLNVTDIGNWSSTDVTYVNVTDGIAPTADAGDNITVEQDVKFMLNASLSTDNVDTLSQLNFTWSFNDTVANVTIYGWNATYTLSKMGVYPFTLVVTDINGNPSLPAKTWVNVTDGIAPVANAGLDFSVKQNVEAMFNGSGSTDNVGVINYTWNFSANDQPVKLYGWNATYVFVTMGSYNVTLTVKDKAGHTATDLMVVTVTDGIAPLAKAGNDTTDEVGANFTFNASASTDNVYIVTYNWSFGDGNWSLAKVAVHAYSAVGVYNVMLTCIDANGNIGTDMMVVTVIPKNNPPSIDPIAAQTATEGVLFTLTVVIKDQDATDIHNFSLKNQPAGMTINANTGVISWTPATNQVWMTYNVTVTVMDKKDTATSVFKISVLAKTISVEIGPIKDKNGKALNGATVKVMSGTLSFTGKTDSKGKVKIDVPGSWAGTIVTVEVKKDNFKTKTFTGTVNQDGSFSPAGGSYPKIESKQTEDYAFLVIVIVVLLVLALVLFSMKRPTEDDGGLIGADEDDEENGEEALSEEE